MASNIAARLDRVLRAFGLSVVSVSIGADANKATWTVQPENLQASAQPTIDAFNPDDPAHEDAELDAAVKAELDDKRLISAVVWTIIDVLAPPATVAKYQNARNKILAAYKTRPWRP